MRTRDKYNIINIINYDIIGLAKDNWNQTSLLHWEDVLQLLTGPNHYFIESSMRAEKSSSGTVSTQS